jgi:hypothetical protein
VEDEILLAGGEVAVWEDVGLGGDGEGSEVAGLSVRRRQTDGRDVGVYTDTDTNAMIIKTFNQF